MAFKFTHVNHIRWHIDEILVFDLADQIPQIVGLARARRSVEHGDTRGVLLLQDLNEFFVYVGKLVAVVKLEIDDVRLRYFDRFGVQASNFIVADQLKERSGDFLQVYLMFTELLKKFVRSLGCLRYVEYLHQSWT